METWNNRRKDKKVGKTQNRRDVEEALEWEKKGEAEKGSLKKWIEKKKGGNQNVSDR